MITLKSSLIIPAIVIGLASSATFAAFPVKVTVTYLDTATNQKAVYKLGSNDRLTVNQQFTNMTGVGGKTQGTNYRLPSPASWTAYFTSTKEAGMQNVPYDALRGILNTSGYLMINGVKAPLQASCYTKLTITKNTTYVTLDMYSPLASYNRVVECTRTSN
jgi:hypothetical protein